MKLQSTREQVYETALRMVADGIAHGAQGNISALDAETGLIAITPSAIPYLKMKVEDIVLVDRQGNVVDGKWRPTSEIACHLVFYQRRADVGAVVHSHAPYSTLFGLKDTPLPMILTEAATCLGGSVPVAPYRRPGTPELAEVVYESTGSGVSVIMARHGLLTVGANLAEAYDSTMAVETTARLVWMAKAMGMYPQPMEEDEVADVRRIYLEKYHPTRNQ